MKPRFCIASASLALACATAVTEAQTVLFSDNFDAGTSMSRYDFFSIDNQTNPATYGAGTFLGDTYANFNFNYGAYTYRYTDPDGITPRTGLIPSAPRSTGGTTIGLRFDVNHIDGPLTTETAIINAYPKLSEFLGGVAPSGDHKLTFDIWMNYNGGFQGGVGSTEWFVAGINQDANGIGGPRLGTEPPGVSRGMSMAVDGERGNSLDYRVYRHNTRFLTTPIATPDPEGGYVAVPDTFNVADGRNAFYQNLFQFPDYETPGAVGKRWNTVDIEYIDGIVYYRINGSLIAARSDDSVTSGNILLGYADFANSIAAPDDITGVDANFAIFDNVEVRQVTQVRPRYVGPSGTWSNAANWINGVPDGNTSTADFIGGVSPRTVNVDGPRTVRSIVFDNASVTLTGDTITLDSLTTGIHGSVVVRGGTHTIAANVSTSRILATSVAAGSTLRLTGDVTTGTHVIKSGPGVAEFKNIRTPGALRINGGTVRIAPNGTNAATSSAAALTLAGATDAWTATLDITDNRMIVDYSGTLSVLGTIRNQIKNGYAGGAWTGTGIISSSAQGAATHAIGFAEALTLLGPGGGTFGGLTVDDTAVLLRYTRQGDANLDGVTDLGDFALLAANFNSPQDWGKGDFNYDGLTDLGDFSLMAANFNQSVGDLPRSAVPEPSVGGFLLAAGALLRRRRPTVV
ncbi:MAG: hypothetical protein NZ561_06595 [Phycisphaerae bacterium]|nr:hypothetical protein [Phycisphaerae bacterium]MDW8263127.1 hypothetical protein [Phycisphaerales bacterium]